MSFVFADCIVCLFEAVGNSVMIGSINNIASSHNPVPGLTQNDSAVAYCNADNLPSNCEQSVCHCPHLVELKLCEAYDFLLTDNGRKYNLTH